MSICSLDSLVLFVMHNLIILAIILFLRILLYDIPVMCSVNMMRYYVQRIFVSN